MDIEKIINKVLKTNEFKNILAEKIAEAEKKL